ncbi:MAG: hypothetical protein AAF502_13790 [Bacteroidota bacterium]
MIKLLTQVCRLLPALLLFVFCHSFANAGNDPLIFDIKKQDQEGSLISGRVLDGTTLEPVKQARVYLNNFPALSAMSDSDGYFQIETGPVNYPSQLTLVCSGDDYYAKEYPLNLVRNQEIISLGWVFLEKIEKVAQPEFTDVLLFGLLIDGADGSIIRTEQSISIEDAPDVNFEIDRCNVFHTRVSKAFFDERDGKFLMNTSAEEYAATITDARLSPGLAYYDFGKIKLTYVRTINPEELAATLDAPNVAESSAVENEPVNPTTPADPVETESPVVALEEGSTAEPEVATEEGSTAEPEVARVEEAEEVVEAEITSVTEAVNEEVVEVELVTEEPADNPEEVPVFEAPTELDTSFPIAPNAIEEQDERQLKELQQAYLLLKTMESQGQFLDREGVDLLAMIFEKYESPESAKHLAALAEEESLTIPCIEEGMKVYRSEYIARLSRMLGGYLKDYNLKEIRVDENQKFYRELLGTLSYLENYYESHPDEPDRESYETTVELFSNVVSRYFKED